MLLDLFKAVVHLQRPLCIFGDLEEALGGQPLKSEPMRKGQKGLIARSRSTATEQTKKEEGGEKGKEVQQQRRVTNTPTPGLERSLAKGHGCVWSVFQLRDRILAFIGERRNKGGSLESRS